MTGALKRSENLDTDGHRVQTQEEGGHVQAKERGLRGNQPAGALPSESYPPEEQENKSVF